MKIIKEPLAHFLLLGAVLFALNAWRSGPRAEADGKATIEVTAGVIERLRAGYERQFGQKPDEMELRGLVAEHVREEVLYREALALGLDRNDTIVRRRMAQKMEFLGQDIATAVEPDEAALRKFFEGNAARYAKAAKVSLRHIYFSRDRRGEKLDADAREALAALVKGAGEETLGDPFLGEHAFVAANETAIEAALGREFAARVMTLPAGEWHGPVASSYGTHLVRVSERAEPQAVPFEAAREAVARDFSEERRLAANRDFIRRLQERYLISVDEAALNQAAAPTSKAAQP